MFMTVLNCNTFCFLVDKRSKEDGDCQSRSGSELPWAVHLQRFESVPGQLSCAHNTPCSGLWRFEKKKKKALNTWLYTCTCSMSAGEQSVDVWSRLKRTCPRKSILEGGEITCNIIAYNSVFGFRKYCYQLPVQSKAQFKAAEKGAIWGCTALLL